MESLKKEMREYISQELNEFVWRLGYPINPAIGLDSFFESFKKEGIAVLLDDRQKRANFVALYEICEKPTVFQTSMDYKSILTGWNKNGFPAVSPNAFYESVYSILEQMAQPFFSEKANCKSKKKRSCFEKIWNDVPLKISHNIKKIWGETFNQYQENLLLPIAGGIPELKKPHLFDEISKDFPWEHFRKARLYDLYGLVRSCPSTEFLVACDWSKFNERSFPSEKSMKIYFWGLYFARLAEEKGYPLNGKSNHLVKKLVKEQDQAFLLAEEIEWALPTLIR